MPGRARTGSGLIALSLRSWRPVWSPPGSNPLARPVNITFSNGQWRRHISHGKVICDSVDLTRTISPRRLRYFYRGLDPNASGLLAALARGLPTHPTSLLSHPTAGVRAELSAVAGQNVDATGRSDADSTHLIIWTCPGTNQRWTLS